MEKTGLTADLVRHWFSTQGSLLQNKPTAAQTTGAVAAGVAGTTGSSPPEQQPAGGMDQKMEQSVSGFTTDAEKTNAEDILNASKGNNVHASSMFFPNVPKKNKRLRTDV